MRRGFVATLIFGLIGLVALISLGVWQLGRIPQKREELDRIDAYINTSPVPMPETIDPDAQEYLPVIVDGRFDVGEIHVLVSTRDYGAGFRIIAPFEMVDGRRIMVDRGFVLSDAKSEERLLGRAEVVGNLHWPDERDRFIPEDDPDTNYWYARDVDKMAAALGTEPILVVAKSSTDDQVLPLPVNTESIPNNHLSYAVQWFLFAVVWLWMTSMLLWRMRTKAL